MNATRIIADHSTEGAVIVCRRIWTECKSDLGCRFAQFVEDQARLNARELFLLVDLENLVHVLAEVEHDRDVATLPCQACAASASEDGRADLATSGNGGDHVLLVSRD